MKDQRSVIVVALAVLILVLAACESREYLPGPSSGGAELARLVISVDPLAGTAQAHLARGDLRTGMNINDQVSLDDLDTQFDPAQTDAPAGVFTIDATFSNVSTDTFFAPFFEVAELSGGNLLLNADGGPGGVGSRVTVPATALFPGESFTTRFRIGLQTRAPFTFFVDAIGSPIP